MLQVVLLPEMHHCHSLVNLPVPQTTMPIMALVASCLKREEKIRVSLKVIS